MADTVWLTLDAPATLTGKFVRDRKVIPVVTRRCSGAHAAWYSSNRFRLDQIPGENVAGSSSLSSRIETEPSD